MFLSNSPTPNKTIVANLKKHHYECDVIEHAATSFKFLIPLKQTVSCADFIELIKKHYSIESPQIKETILILNKFSYLKFSNK